MHSFDDVIHRRELPQQLGGAGTQGAIWAGELSLAGMKTLVVLSAVHAFNLPSITVQVIDWWKWSDCCNCSPGKVSLFRDEASALAPLATLRGTVID